MCKDTNSLEREKRKFLCDAVVARFRAGVMAGNGPDVAEAANETWDRIIKLTTGDKNNG